MRVNNQIRAAQVAVIDGEGTQLGTVDIARAIELAQEQGLDLVEVSPVADPPVCRIMDYGAYQYQQEKKERKQKAKQKKVEIKGIRLSLKIGPHDLEMRKNQSVKFIEKGNKVRIELILRGRERAHIDRAKETMKKFVEMISESVLIYEEQPFSKQGSRLSMLISKK